MTERRTISAETGSRVGRLLKGAMTALKVPDSWKSLGPIDVLFVRHDADCGFVHDGRPYSQLLDSVRDRCAHRGLTAATVASPFSRYVGDAAHGSPVAVNRAILRINLAGILRRCLAGTRGGREWAATRRTVFWNDLLNLCDPVAVAAIQPDPSLCRAARARGIEVFELQHGVIDDAHPVYGSSRRHDVTPDEMPNTYLVWDEASAEVLRNWAVPMGSEVQVVGNPWFARFDRRASGDRLVREAIATFTLRRDSRPVVLHTLSWGLEVYYDDPDFNGIMCTALEEAILNTAGEYTWLLRRHPVEMADRESARTLEYLERTFGHLESVEWDQASRAPLPLVLSQTDVHVTDLSSVVKEAAWFGIPSAMLNVWTRPGEWRDGIYEYERRQGLVVTLPQDAKAIEDWLRETIDRGRGSGAGLPAVDGMRSVIDGLAARADQRRATRAEPPSGSVCLS